ncbi:uncharacterized protein PSFLO_06840 [Pseudozyma flocculosa]|uniref:Uncharacterized protein n=1 Tax=Pseudozyma flocculosa TaxID=84751 RepID=A0A5C3FA72_9BASI|nr:uncharacterized protein PSFLO_06840 [Pseudozyma flocculosa]
MAADERDAATAGRQASAAAWVHHTVNAGIVVARSFVAAAAAGRRTYVCTYSGRLPVGPDAGAPLRPARLCTDANVSPSWAGQSRAGQGRVGLTAEQVSPSPSLASALPATLL